MTPADFEAHVYEWQDLLDFHLMWIKPTSRRINWAQGGANAVACRRPTSAAHYAVAMHEIGHIACEHRGGKEGKTKRQREIEAWAWARTHARWWPDEAQERMVYSLNRQDIGPDDADGAELHRPIGG